MCQDYYASFSIPCQLSLVPDFVCDFQYSIVLRYFCDLMTGAWNLIKEYLCEAVRVDLGPIKEKILSPYKRLKKSLNESLYFDIKVDYNFKFQIIEKKKENLKTIFRRLGDFYELHFGWILAIIKSLDLLTYLLAFFWLFKAWDYTRKYQLYDAFDNQYITDEILDIEWRRHKKGEPTILPLTSFQRRHFIPVWTFTMLPSEYQRLLIGLVAFTVILVQILFFVVLEFLVYYPTLGILEVTKNIDQIYPIQMIEVQSGGQK